MKSRHTNWYGQKQPRSVPNMLWSDSKPLKMVKKDVRKYPKLARNGLKMVVFNPNWSEIVQRSPNSMMNPLKGKKMGVTREKNGRLTPKTLF